ncbi:MAG: phage holin family protein [Candidatus Riflebacteria bacterium]|nr:phage holin family protein [Candidatus Riflebacteria bacterium]
MAGALVGILINTCGFYGISKLLPGFKVKDEKTALMISVVFSLLGLVAAVLIAPLALVMAVILAFFAFIPVLGPIIAGAAALVTTFVLYFLISTILLIVIDKFLEDFQMDSYSTALIASVLLAAINVGTRILLHL